MGLLGSVQEVSSELTELVLSAGVTAVPPRSAETGKAVGASVGPVLPPRAVAAMAVPGSSLLEMLPVGVKGSPAELSRIPFSVMVEATVSVLVEMEYMPVTLPVEPESEEDRARVGLVPVPEGGISVWKESPGLLSGCLIVSRSHIVVMGAPSAAEGKEEERVPLGLVSKGTREPATPLDPKGLVADGRGLLPKDTPTESPEGLGCPPRGEMPVAGVSRAWPPVAEPTKTLAV